MTLVQQDTLRLVQTRDPAPPTTTQPGAERSRPGGGRDSGGTGGYRRDVQGLRAVAVLAVVLGHAGVPMTKGGYVGVDVFFVISGFLITGHLLRELDSTGTVRLRGFYARRIRRLLPAATAVVLVTAAATFLFESSLAGRRLAMDTLWVAGSALNVRLALDGTDYFASEEAPSTLQHFWSLAVEEQFYLVWPLLLLALAAAWRWRRSPSARPDGGRAPMSRRPLVACLLVVIAVSLGLSVWQTDVAQSWAYFGLHTRAWELAAGALVAVLLPGLSTLPERVAAVVSWCGLGAITVAILAFDEQTPFPGYAALLPVAGAVAVLVGGSATGSAGARRLLGASPLQGIGNVSYSWYLWHWPVLMLMPAVLGWERTVANNLFVVLVALLISVVGFITVESPARTARPLLPNGRSLLLGVGLTASLLATSGAALAALPPAVGHGSPISVVAGDAGVVAEALRLEAAPVNLTPAVDVAADDVPASRDNGCHLQLLDSTVRTPCEYGDTAADSTMVLFGDSHADQWLPALDTVARDNGYRLLGRTKAACPAADMVVRDGDLGREYRECTSWRADVMDEILQERPDVVVMSASYGVGNKSSGDWGRAMTTTVSAMTEAGITVVFVADTPRRDDGSTGPDCVAENIEEVSRCATPQDQALPHRAINAAVLQAVQRSGGLTLDPVNWFCAEDACPAVIGNFLVHRDQSHVTASYAQFLAPELERTLGLRD